MSDQINELKKIIAHRNETPTAIKERNEHGTFYVNVCNPDYIVPQILKGTKYINFTITV